MQQMPDISMLMKIAQSPAGRQLLSLLQENGGSELSSIMNDVSTGKTENAKKKLSSILSSQEARTLLKQLEDSI